MNEAVRVERVVIGGIGRMEGPLIGTIVFFLLRGLFADFGAWYLMLLGAFAIIVTCRCPKALRDFWRSVSISNFSRFNVEFASRNKGAKI
jgi:ABC-type branched-subunit amino acid transport system permease subunit